MKIQSIKLIIFIFFLFSLQGSLYSQKSITGETKQLGNGTAITWIKLDGNGNPSSIGVTISETALSGLPKRDDPGGMQLLADFVSFEYDINFPAEASKTPFTHFGLNWNPGGHIPPQFYGFPHFDFHFYTISMEDRNKIIGTGDDTLNAYKQPQQDMIPKDYMLAPMSSEPMMGSHWFDPSSPEFQPGGKFTTTFIYGFYNAKVVFMEPMITLSYLNTKPNFSGTVKQPSAYLKSGVYYPTSYTVKYDENNKEYTISLDDMVLR